MTNTTDAALGAITGLMAVGIMANVASNMIKPRPNYDVKEKSTIKGKLKKGSKQNESFFW